MNLTLDIDDETTQKICMLASAQNTTVEAMVVEYLTGIAGSHADATERKAQADKFRETVTKFSRDMGPRTWTRDDLYEERLGRHGR